MPIAATANLPCGVLIPNRIFVGGISGDTTESDLSRLFSAYGNVKSAKIIVDRAGISKGYGFVTFETEEEALKIQVEPKSVVLKDRKLSIAPAIMKKPSNMASAHSYSAVHTPISSESATAGYSLPNDFNGTPNYPPMPYQPCYYYCYGMPMNNPNNTWQNYQNIYPF